MTILESLLNYLPTKYVDAVVNNVREIDDLSNPRLCIAHDLMCLFDWDESKQGYQFWENVLEAILEDKRLPMLPIPVEYIPGSILAVNNTLLLMNIANTGLNIQLDIDLVQLSSKHIDQKKKEQIFSLLN